MGLLQALILTVAMILVTAAAVAGGLMVMARLEPVHRPGRRHHH
jgi:hypothetical protein